MTAEFSDFDNTLEQPPAALPAGLIEVAPVIPEPNEASLAEIEQNPNTELLALTAEHVAPLAMKAPFVVPKPRPMPRPALNVVRRPEQNFTPPDLKDVEKIVRMHCIEYGLISLDRAVNMFIEGKDIQAVTVRGTIKHLLGSLPNTELASEGRSKLCYKIIHGEDDAQREDAARKYAVVEAVTERFIQLHHDPERNIKMQFSRALRWAKTDASRRGVTWTRDVQDLFYGLLISDRDITRVPTDEGVPMRLLIHPQRPVAPIAEVVAKSGEISPLQQRMDALVQEVEDSGTPRIFAYDALDALLYRGGEDRRVEPRLYHMLDAAGFKRISGAKSYKLVPKQGDHEQFEKNIIATQQTAQAVHEKLIDEYTTTLSISRCLTAAQQMTELSGDFTDLFVGYLENSKVGGVSLERDPEDADKFIVLHAPTTGPVSTKYSAGRLLTIEDFDKLRGSARRGVSDINSSPANAGKRSLPKPDMGIYPGQEA